MKTLLLFLLLTTTSFAQGITINVSQDARLLFFGDDKGNDAGTIDITIRSEWRGNQTETGYFFFAPEFEIAELKGGTYRRYTANIGYTFNKWIDRLAFTSSIGYGILDYNAGSKTYGMNFQTAYLLTSKIELFIDLEIARRGDLDIFARQSGKFGVKYRIN